MAKRVTMHFWPNLKPGHTIAPPPLAKEWGTGTSHVFDGPLAREYGRACGPDSPYGPICEGACDGDCWALLFVGSMNAGFEKLERKPFSADPVGEAPPVQTTTIEPIEILVNADTTVESETPLATENPELPVENDTPPVEETTTPDPGKES